MKKKPAKKSPTDRALDRAIADITSHRTRIREVVGELETTVICLRHSAREFEKMLQEFRHRGVLDLEVEKAIARLKTTFRDGPLQINESLIKLAQDILQEQIRSVLQDQMHNLAKELAQIAREEIQAEVFAAVRDALEKDTPPSLS